MDEQEQQVLKLIEQIKVASEVDLLAHMFQQTDGDQLRRSIQHLEKSGLVRRVPGFFKGGFGDGLELTREGYKSLK